MSEPYVVPNTNKDQVGTDRGMREDARAAHTAFRDAVGDTEECQYNPRNARPRGSSTAHPGFQKVQANIAKRMNIPQARAGAILASASRHASAAAKRKNPRLRKVRG